MNALIERLQTQLRYAELRQENPLVPAVKLFAYANGAGHGQTLQEFLCPGHEWVYTGTQYGSDDESYHGEGRCYCLNCGADGDA